MAPRVALWVFSLLIAFPAAAAPVERSIVAFTLSELAREAAIICTCRAMGQQNLWDADRNMMVTTINLQADEYFKGQGGAELVVEVLSGFAPGKGAAPIAGAVFEQEERAVLFLAPVGVPAADETQHYVVVQGAQGKFTIRVDPQTGEERVEWNWRGAHAPGEADLQTLPQLTAAIRGAVGPDGGPAPTP